MAYRYDEFAPGEVYHIYTRGVEKRDIFSDDTDRARFIALLKHSMPQRTIQSFSTTLRLRRKEKIEPEGKGLIDLLCYCLMSNHIHLLVHENTKGGITLYMKRLLTSYAKYFNIKKKRSGSLFTNPFKAVLVDKDEQLLHVSRYIHLNAYTANIVKNIYDYPWSSLSDYISNKKSVLCHTDLISGMLPPREYKVFMQDQADYIRSIEDSEHLLIDIDE